MKGQPVITRWRWPDEPERHGATTLQSSIVEALFKSGLRTDEIANKLGISEATVANSLSRLRELRGRDRGRPKL